MKITSRCKVKKKNWERQTFNMLFFCSIQPFIYCRYQSINFLNRKASKYESGFDIYTQVSQVQKLKELNELSLPMVAEELRHMQSFTQQS